ncbi:hypothetical protein [Rummeliibacillus sp. BSL5]
MKKLLTAALSTSLLLGACGASPENKNETKKETKTEVKTNNNILSEYGDVKEYYNKEDLSYKEETGPMKFEITGVNIADLKPSEEYSFIFNDLKVAHVIVVSLNTENTTKDEVWFSADHPTVVTDNGQQVDATAHDVSKIVGEDFKGAVSKNGRVVFFLDKAIKDIKKITLHFEAPVDKNKEPIGKETKVVIPLK